MISLYHALRGTGMRRWSNLVLDYGRCQPKGGVNRLLPTRCSCMFGVLGFSSVGLLPLTA